ncbi:MAG: hypothetical protein CSB48_10895 [Proteobacteria bacterium]|nr:MAG: hypothetical protein CSB48_10895 [Pseudomonadota bacterium]PIE40049.1 MAG: hypothetical protein CSA51_02660 [Gammaproteobacteria bacterium]
MPANHPQSPNRPLLISRILVLISGTLVSGLLYFFTAEHQDRQSLFRLELVARERTIALAKDSGDLTTAIFALENLMRHNPESSYRQFSELANVFLMQSPEIRTLEWAPLVNQNEPPELTANTNTRNLSGYRVNSDHEHNHQMNNRQVNNRQVNNRQVNNRETGKEDQNRPPKSFFKDQHIPIRYQVRNGKTPEDTGFDLMSTGLFRDAIKQAIREKRPVISQTFGSQESTGRHALTRMFLPVYQDSEKAILTGIVSMVIDIRKLIEPVAYLNRSLPVPFEIYDTGDHTKIPLYHWPAGQVFNATDSNLQGSETTLPFFDREWQIIHSATDDYRQQFRSHLPLWLFLIGMVSTLAIYIVIRLVQSKTDKLTADSNEKFWQLEQSSQLLHNRVIERNTFERSYQELQERLIDYLAVSDSYYWEVDKDCRFTFLSKKVRQVIGIPGSSLIGSRIIACLQVDDAEALKEAMERSRSTGRVFSLDVRFQADKNQWRWGRINGKAMYNTSGDCTGFRGICSDISQEKQRADTSPGYLDNSPGHSFAAAPLTDQPFYGKQTDQTGPDTRLTEIHEESDEEPGSAFRKLAAEFAGNHRTTLDSIQAAHRKGHNSNMEKVLHRLQKDAKKIGSDALYRESEQLLKAIKEGSPQTISAHIDALGSHLKPIITNMLQSAEMR